MFEDLITSIWEFTNSTHPALQWIVVMFAGALPILEGHGATFLGIAAGVNPIVAAVAAGIGNLISMLTFVALSGRFRERLAKDVKRTERKEKLHKTYDKYGVPVVSLVAEFWLPSGLTSVLLLTFGASKHKVILWQTITIIVWTALAALAATGVVTIFF